MSSAANPPASRELRRPRLPREWLAVLGLSLAAVAHADTAGTAAPSAASTYDDIEILQYRTRIEPDLVGKSVAGTTTIRFRPTRAATAEIVFPLNALQIDAVRLNGAATPFQVRTGAAPSSLVVPLAGKTTGAEELAVDYHGTPAQGMKFGANYVYTAFSTCHWMLCREESGGKAAFRLELIVPSGYKVVAGGVARSREALPGGRTLHVWEEERPYSPYLFGFAAGEMNEATAPSGGMSLRMLGVGQGADELARKFQDTARMLAFFEAKAGGPLPHKTYTQVLVPGSEAQEAGTFSIIGRDQLDPILADPQEDWVIAHELAHQWWGNLITCRDWSHFWLNEGLTVFMTAAYKERRWGPAAYAREIALAEKRRQNAINANFDVPLAYAGAYPSLSVKRAVTYSKGFLFIDLLRKRLGEEKFWRGIKAYTQAHLGKTVDSRDFQRALEAASGESLAELFGQWVYPL